MRQLACATSLMGANTYRLMSGFIGGEVLPGGEPLGGEVAQRQPAERNTHFDATAVSWRP
jgi:hypothetical protein